MSAPFSRRRSSFQNSTSSYTFLEIKLGSIDYTSTLSPGQQTSFFPVGQGLYTLSTREIDGVLLRGPKAIELQQLRLYDNLRQ